MKRYLAKILTISLAIIVVAMCVEVGILYLVNRSNAYKMTNVLLNQVVDIVRTNQTRSGELYASLKEDYKIRAQSAAYILDINPSAEKDTEELRNIAKLLSVDELHVFNSNGTIYAGTNPEYFGLKLNGGEQISYFIPMLSDKTLTMCQDVVPNTAEGKQMMYAMTWNKAGTKMIQIGIEPFRLIEVLKRTGISEVIKNIPAYDGIKLFVADSQTGEILGANEEGQVFTNLSEINFVKPNLPASGTKNRVLRINGQRHYSSIRCSEDYVYCVAYYTYANIKHFGLIMWIIFAYLLLAALCITFTILDKAKSTEEKMIQYRVLLSMSEIYYSMHLIDLKKNSVTEYSSSDELRRINKEYSKADKMMDAIISRRVSRDYKESMLAFTDLKTLTKRFTGKKIITEDFIGISGRWFRASFVTIKARKGNIPEQVIFTIQDIQDEKEKEAVLVHKSTTDELTGLLNRRAYQDDLKKLQVTDDFALISFDLNELKNANDTLGHEGGDELIKTAAHFMKKHFGNYGNIYRTGGDEFVAVLYVTKEIFSELYEEFEASLNGWTGELAKSISVSYGCVFSREAAWKTIHDIEKEADNRMYKCKAAYYQKSGVDRRVNQKAYFAASALYTKILKINLTSDSYRIINMDKTEQIAEKGFGETISAWLKDFALTNQVHAEDKENYLANTDLNYMRNYFASDKKLLSISYRRKIGEVYKRVIMEIIPSDDYTSDNQDCYLYVKKIDE